MEQEAGKKLGVFNGLVIWNIVFEYKWAISKWAILNQSSILVTCLIFSIRLRIFKMGYFVKRKHVKLHHSQAFRGYSRSYPVHKKPVLTANSKGN